MAVTASLETVETYLTAAQAAFSSGDYDETEKQLILGEIELNKLAQSDGLDGEATTMRGTFDKLRQHVTEYRLRMNRGTRRSIAREV